MILSQKFVLVTVPKDIFLSMKEICTKNLILREQERWKFSNPVIYKYLVQVIYAS